MEVSFFPLLGDGFHVFDRHSAHPLNNPLNQAHTFFQCPEVEVF